MDQRSRDSVKSRGVGMYYRARSYDGPGILGCNICSEVKLSTNELKRQCKHSLLFYGRRFLASGMRVEALSPCLQRACCSRVPEIMVYFPQEGFWFGNQNKGFARLITRKKLIKILISFVSHSQWLIYLKVDSPSNALCSA